MKFGLMFFAASEDSLAGDRYRLLVESARFADEHGFSSVWVPERHFTRFGGLYPNPAILHAALAMCTRTIRLNAGSVVAPLHHPIRIAEEWAVVDNLSNGRVGLSFASGWNPDDFVFFPERYATRHEHVFDTIRAVQGLWRGEPMTAASGSGDACAVRTYPTPVQRELPIWVTAAGHPRTFERAGAAGTHLLTHLLDQDEAVLASKLELYRKARAAAGFDPVTGEVTLMLHAFVGADAARVREEARRPYCEYIKANLGLLTGLARSRGRDADLAAMSPADRDEFVNYLYDRFAAERGLIGTPESCVALVSRLERIGVTEVACLLDFGPDANQILANLPHLARLKDLGRGTVEPAAPIVSRSVQAFVPDAVRARCGHEISGDEFHAVLRRHGIEIDGAFQSVRTVWRRDGEALAALALGEPADGDGYHVYPAALDACSRILAAALPARVFDGAAAVYVPAGMRACEVHGALTGVVWSHATVTAAANGGSPSFTGDVRIYDAQGRLLAEIDGLRLEPLDRPVASRHAAGVPGVDRLLYERTWQQTPRGVVASGAGDAGGKWLVIGNGGHSRDGDDRRGSGEVVGPAARIEAELVRQIVALGGECVDTEGAARAGVASMRGVVYLCGLDAVSDPDAETDVLRTQVDLAVFTVLDLVRGSSSLSSVPIWIVTSGATPVPHSTRPISVAQAPLWGLGRVLAVERPGALGALVDLDPAAPARESARQLLDVMTATRDEDMIAFRAGERFVPRLTRIETGPPVAKPLAFGPDETVVIAGGSGGLGLCLAAWLAKRGVSHLILVSRRAPSAQARGSIDALIASGVDVVPVQADVSDYGELTQQIERASEGRPPLSSVFHLAGVLDDAPLADQTQERFDRVFSAKVDGAWNLHRLTRGAPLTHFVMFSSVASMVAVPGQANYAAANAFLDALAHYRSAGGLPALAVNWGPWAEAGHAATEYGKRAHDRLAALGIGTMAVVEGLDAMEALLQRGCTQAAAVAIDWPRLFHADPAAARLGLLASLVREAGAAASVATHTTDGAGAGRPSDLVATLRALPSHERRPHLMRYLSDLIVAALKLRTEEPIDSRQRLFDLGLDSILALELKNRLERVLDRPLSATLLFVHPTLESLSGHILDEFVGVAPPELPDAPEAMSLSEEELTALLLRELDAGHGR